jgi:hypothetical protein
MSAIYKSKRAEFDDKVYAYIMKRLRCPIDKSDSFMTGVVDDMGNAKGEPVGDSYWACTKLDRFLIQVRNLLGPRGVEQLTHEYDDYDPMYLMQGGSTENYWDRFTPVISLVEETAYLPPEQRGKGDYIDENTDDGLTKEQRLGRALTIANVIIAAIKGNNELVSDYTFNNFVLPSVEATFNVRSVGSRNQIIDFLKKGGLADYRQLSPEGVLLGVRLAKRIVENKLCSDSKDENNYAKEWRQLATYGG